MFCFGLRAQKFVFFACLVSTLLGLASCGIAYRGDFASRRTQGIAKSTDQQIVPSGTSPSTDTSSIVNPSPNSNSDIPQPSPTPTTSPTPTPTPTDTPEPTPTPEPLPTPEPNPAPGPGVQHLRISANTSVVAGLCHPFLIMTYNADDTPQTVKAATNISISTSAIPAVFYSDSSCSSPITSWGNNPITVTTTASIAGGKNSVMLYYRHMKAGDLMVTVIANGYYSAKKTINLVHGPAKRIVIRGPATMKPNSCSIDPYAIDIEDPWGNPVAVTGAINLDILGTGTFYASAGCTGQVIDHLQLNNTASGSFYLREGAVLGESTLRASTGLSGIMKGTLLVSTENVTCDVLAAPGDSLKQKLTGLTPGHTLCLHSGTYKEDLADKIPSGTSSASVTVRSYPGEIAVIQPPSTSSFVLKMGGANVGYINIIGLVLDGQNVSDIAVWLTGEGYSGAGVHHITLKQLEIKNAIGGGIEISKTVGRVGQSEYNQMIALKVHHGGATDFKHGFYISTNHNLIDRCDVYNNSGWGIHIYMTDAVNGVDNSFNVVSNNMVHDNAAAGGRRGVGIGIYGGDSNSIFNNLVWNNKTGMTAQYGATNTRFFNNTVYANEEEGVLVGYGSPATSGTQLINNIIIGNQGVPIAIYETGLVENYNILEVKPNTSPNNDIVTSNPGFNDVNRLDFSLSANSPAIDRGADLSSFFNYDFGFTKRPQGAAFDIGAFERP